MRVPCFQTDSIGLDPRRARALTNRELLKREECCAFSQLLLYAVGAPFRAPALKIVWLMFVLALSVV